MDISVVVPVYGCLSAEFVATNCLIGGIIIMVVGLAGIYVGNIFMQSKQRPLYVVRQMLNEEREDADSNR